MGKVQSTHPVLSIVIPSLRESQLERCLERVYAHTAGIDYQVVVVSPFEVTGDRIKHIMESEPQGSCAAIRSVFSSGMSRPPASAESTAASSPRPSRNPIAWLETDAGNRCVADSAIGRELPFAVLCVLVVVLAGCNGFSA